MTDIYEQAAPYVRQATASLARRTGAEWDDVEQECNAWIAANASRMPRLLLRPGMFVKAMSQDVQKALIQQSGSPVLPAYADAEMDELIRVAMDPERWSQIGPEWQPALARVRKALSSLPERESEALAAVVAGGETCKQFARRRDVRRQTIEKHVSRARARVRRMLEGERDGAGGEGGDAPVRPAGAPSEDPLDAA